MRKKEYKSIYSPIVTKHEIGYGLSEKMIRGIEKKQADILSNAINRCIFWLKNLWSEDKNMEDNRGYKNGLVTKIRHSLWGDDSNKANELFETLTNLESSGLNLLAILQSHFKNKLKLYNHSLDTYLLEAIYQNKNLFFLTTEFNLKNKDERNALKKFIMNISSIDFYSVSNAYKMAHLYEMENNIIEACYFYAVALHLDKNLANKDKVISFIKKHLLNTNNDQYLIFAFNLYSILASKNDEKALEEMKLIAIQFKGNKLQLGLVDFCIKELSKYEVGLSLLKNMVDNKVQNAAEQMRYYVEIDHKYAHYAAVIYADSKKIEDIDKACVYFAIAIQSNAQSELVQKQFDDLLSSERIPPECLIQLADKYLNGTDGIFINYSKSKKYLEISRDRGCVQAYYKLGLFYETVPGHRDMVKAVVNYEIAKTKGVILSAELLNPVIISVSDLLALARLYETGDEFVPADLEKAMTYYQIAANQGNKTAALYLAQLYEVDQPHCKRDKIKAFTLYVRAAELKESDALNPIERIAKEIPSYHYADLIRIYTTIFHNPQKANYWSSESKKIEEAKKQFSNNL